MAADNPATSLPGYELFSPEALRDPMPLLRQIQAEAPVVWVPELQAYLLTRYEDIVTALNTSELSAKGNLTRGMDMLDEEQRRQLQPLRDSVELWLGNSDDQDHLRIQQLLKRYFTPATVDGLRPRMREITHRLLDAVASANRMDVVADLAYPLPAAMIAEMFGLSRGDDRLLHGWSHDIGAVFEGPDLPRLRQCQRSVLEMQDYLRPLVRARRERPRSDLLSVLATAVGDGVLSEDEAVANCVALLIIGHETTVSLIANGLLALLDHPDQLAALRAEPDLMPLAVEEVLRTEGPAALVVRVSTEQVQVAGVPCPAGTYFFLAARVANRDPRVFSEPDRFHIRRKPNRHIGFGLGATYCLGAALARAQAQESLRIVLDRFPTLRTNHDSPAWQPVIPFGRRLTELAVVF